MNDFGFIRVAAAVPEVRLASVGHNVEDICRLIDEAARKETSIIVFPELAVTGATCGDLFCNRGLLDAAENGVNAIVGHTRDKGITVVVGTPVRVKGRLYSCAAVINDGILAGLVPKTHISRENTRWFVSGSDFQEYETIVYAGGECVISNELLFESGKAIFAVEIGEDMMAPTAQSSRHAEAGALLILHPAADADVIGSHIRTMEALGQQSRRTSSIYVHASAGYGESTQDHVHSGAASIWENGILLKENERFRQGSSLLIADADLEAVGSMGGNRSQSVVELGEPCTTDFNKSFYRNIPASPFLPNGEEDSRCSEALAIQTAGLAKRISHINCRSLIIGISGGLDSTLALLVAALAFDATGRSREGIIGVTMPGFGTTTRTKNNAWDLMKALGITCREISIVPACEQHFKDIGHDPAVHDATYENSQARERTQILMDLANKEGGIVIGTGDMSELALGWATYNGDHMSMYGVNAGIPKTMVRSIVEWTSRNRFQGDSADGRTVQEILADILDTPISPELLPASEDGNIAQVTEDLVGPYELHDFFLYNIVGQGFSPQKVYFLASKAFNQVYDDQTIMKWLKTFIRRFFSQQFKRSCMPDGPQVCQFGLSPRGGLMMPSDAWSSEFLAGLD